VAVNGQGQDAAKTKTPTKAKTRLRPRQDPLCAGRPRGPVQTQRPLPGASVRCAGVWPQAHLSSRHRQV